MTTMIKLCLFCCVFAVFISASVAQNELAQKLVKILKNVYKYQTNILVHITETPHVDVLFELIKGLNLAVAFQRPSGYHPSGYLLVGDNVDLLRQKCQTLQFTVQRSLVIIYLQQKNISTTADINFNVSPFRELVDLQGVDVIVIMLELKVQTKWGLLDVVGLRGESLRNGTTIHGKLPQWKPNWSTMSKFKIIAFDCRPYVYYDKDKGFFSGFEKLLIELLMELTTWPWEYNLRTYGYQIGALQELQKKLVDASLGSHVDSPSAKFEVDMTVPYAQMCISFYVHKPALLPKATFVFQPFQFETWVTLIAVVLLLAGCYTLKKTPFAEATIRMFQLILGSSIHTFPADTFHRVLVTTTTVSAILLTTNFLASYSSTFASPRYEKPISTIQDMLDRNISWGEDSKATYVLLNSSKNDRLEALLHRYEYFAKLKDRNARFRRGGFAVHAQKLENHFLAKLDMFDGYMRQHAMVLNECYANMHMLIPLQRNSPFKQILDELIYRLNENGFTIHFLKMTQQENANVYKHTEMVFSPYSNEYVYQSIELTSQLGAFYLLIGGLSISFFVFFIELFLGHWH